jgi:ribosomal protein L7/L12
MAETALVVSIVALVVALMALGIATSTAARVRLSGPRPNVLTSLGQSSVGEPLTASQPSAEVVAFINAGKKIQAIKQYRMETGVGLKEAKDAVEAFERGQR